MSHNLWLKITTNWIFPEANESPNEYVSWPSGKSKSWPSIWQPKLTILKRADCFNFGWKYSRLNQLVENLNSKHTNNDITIRFHFQHFEFKIIIINLDRDATTGMNCTTFDVIKIITTDGISPTNQRLKLSARRLRLSYRILNFSCFLMNEKLSGSGHLNLCPRS